MKKKIILVVAAVLLIALAIPAYAAVTSDQQKAINTLQKQMLDTRKQLVDKYVESGQMTKDQGDLAKERMTTNYDYQAKQNFAPGTGRGYGMMGGGFGGGCGGYGVNQSTTATQNNF